MTPHDLLPDRLWERVAPHLPPAPPRPSGGRPRADDRAALAGILFVLHTGAPWRHLDGHPEVPSAMTCWRRFAQWQDQGVWLRLHHALLDELGTTGRIGWERACLDSGSLRAKKGG